ncbi:hypothetical protein Bca4012_063718 [Brassica carinata]
MSKEIDKNRVASPTSYDTFQGVPTYPPLLHPRPPSHHPVSGFPQPSPPLGATHHDLSVHKYVQEHQTVPGKDMLLMKEDLLDKNVFLVVVLESVGSFILVCAKINPQEKPGYIACAIAAVLATIAIVFGFMGGREVWSERTE